MQNTGCQVLQDLGGAINTTAKQQSNVLNDRIGAALATLRRFRFLPHDADTKAQFVHINVLAGALYGIECSEPSGAMIQKLQSAIVDALGFHSARACNAIAFELTAKNSDIDPHVQQLLRRTTMFRRMWAPTKADIEMLIQAKTGLFRVVSPNSAVMYPWFDHMRSSYLKHVLPFTTEKIKHAGTQFMKKQVTVTTAHFETLKTHMHANSSDDSKPWHDGFSGGENEIIEYCNDTLMNVNGGAMSEAIQSAKTAHITLVNGV